MFFCGHCNTSTWCVVAGRSVQSSQTAAARVLGIAAVVVEYVPKDGKELIAEGEQRTLLGHLALVFMIALFDFGIWKQNYYKYT